MYRNRSEAGKELGKQLRDYRDQDPLILALPRGGVEVGYEVAGALGAPLDVLVVRKLGAPQNPEFGLGAIASYGGRYIDPRATGALNVSEETISRVEQREREELRRREEAYRGDAPPPRIEGRTVILVDDGVATGGTVRAAIQAVRTLKPQRIVLAVPVAPPETADAIAEDVDDVVCPLTPRAFRAVGQWYEQFDQTPDERVVELLKEARARTD